MQMPYLAWETDRNRAKMSRTVKQVQALKHDIPMDATQDKDIALIAGYLNDANLHVRRTLDQFKHHSIDTEKRDTDQVVYRYCKDNPFPYEDPENSLKVFMVDQLWIWILGNSKLIFLHPFSPYDEWNHGTIMKKFLKWMGALQYFECIS